MVELIIENETETELLQQQIDELKSVCEAIMTGEDCNFDAEISLIFTDNDGIREINNEYRGIDKATDVLSFPMLEFDSDEEDADYETDGGLVMLGDIVISLERAREQAAELGHSVRRELAFLTAHSMLHLLGWDHVDDAEGERYMIDRQNKTLDGLGLTREIEEF